MTIPHCVRSLAALRVRGPPVPKIPVRTKIAQHPRFFSVSTSQANASSVPPTRPPPPPTLPTPKYRPSFWSRHPVIKYTFLGAGSIVFGLTATVAIILAYDFTTYSERHVGEVTVPDLALHPESGGPKNLPILSSYVGDVDDDNYASIAKKERLVIVGGGWGAVAVMETLDPGKYHVTVVSPTNYFLFTPLLPSAAVGTVEPRSLVEGLRRILKRVDGHYIQGKAVDVVLPSQLDSPSQREQSKHLLEVAVIADDTSEPNAADNLTKHVYVPYDKLIIACGSVTNTHGVPGMENSFLLKTIPQVRAIRSKIVSNLEVASLPTTTPEERDRLLSFVICGGGPTGVETAAEIFDMMNEDVLRLYPKLIPAQVKVSVIQSREHILNTYAEKISEYAERKFSRDGVQLITNARVKAIGTDKVVYTVRKPDNTVEEFSLPSGFTLWSTGIAMNPFTKRLTQVLPNQFHLKALMVDSHMRVKGSNPGTMYAIGDAATIDNRLIDHLYEWVEKHDTDSDGRLAYDEFVDVVKEIGHEFPLATRHFAKLDKMFQKYDADQDNKLSINELASLLLGLQQNLTAYPATAQTASQQGKYLGKMLNHLAAARDQRLKNITSQQLTDSTSETVQDRKVTETPLSISAKLEEENYPPFQFRNLGSLAYIGNAAAFDIPFLPEKVGQFAGGLFAMYIWRSFYLSEQVDSRTRLLLLVDWIKRGIYGRDLSKM